jgi:hypothetical protein
VSSGKQASKVPGIPLDIHGLGRSSSKLSAWLTGDVDKSPCRSTLSNMAVRTDKGDVDRVTESGGEPEMKATRLRSSVALRLDCELARAFRLAWEVEMDGCVAEARISLGLL